MNCTEFSNLLDDLLAGRLAPADAERLRAHAAQCAECAHLLAVRMDCQALDEELETSDRFAQGWRQRIREEEKMEEKRQRKKRAGGPGPRRRRQRSLSWEAPFCSKA